MGDTRQQIKFNHCGVGLVCSEWGDRSNPSMLLLHGLQDCGRSWEVFAQSMSSEYWVVALDSRGHGDSDHTPGSYAFLDYISDVEATILKLGIENPILIGHSAGGRYAFSYAAHNPNRVKALVVVDIDPDAVNETSGSMFERYKNESDEWDNFEDLVDRIWSRQPQSSEEMVRFQAEVMTVSKADGGRVWKRDRNLIYEYERPDLWETWKAVDCPAVIVRGRQSTLLTHETAVRMKEATGNCRLAELEGGGHWFYQESPSSFESTVKWFLNSI
ncbi:MAG: Pimeloyl-ACP methyl ester carboxylesterase [Chloroflexi bacterium]|nr:MAG: Pimeloyl-ACP methyl ester carboxylesterase [Chloroflexota bacterium]